MAKKLVIVESPAKAKTIGKFLGSGYVVEASIGHIRDLPKGAADVPESEKGKPWASLGVDTENGFKPLYVIPAQKRDQIRKLKAALKDADELFLATDEDREGESISWHLLEVLAPKPNVQIHRMVFHEITKPAIEAAVRNTRDIDYALVDAQETRRILDRLYGYELSPVLWRKVLPKLSAGRVQSVATRMIVERERERMKFRSGTWWDLEAQLKADSTTFSAGLVGVNGKRVATGKDFDPATGQLSAKDVAMLDEKRAVALAEGLANATFTVLKVNEKPEARRPSAPFMTSTLQQEGARKLGMSAQQVMSVAQRLYEGGYITYMRTDSTTLSTSAIESARAQARELYGAAFVPDSPRRYDRKVKNAQEAHEAIRPSGDVFRLPDDVGREIGGAELRLYDLIWKRTVASQMSDARVLVVNARLGATATDGTEVEFSASGSTITFPGYLRAYVEGADDPEADLADRERFLPTLTEGQKVPAKSVIPQSHTTSPPARFTEASLVKRLEEAGIGRPSTYASILGRIQDQGYVFKKSSALVPTWTAFAVTALMEQHFGRFVNYDFTAQLEDDLDEIAAKNKNRTEWLQHFYYGNGSIGLKGLIAQQLDEIDPRAVGAILIGKDESGEDISVRVGRYGPYLSRGEDKCSMPDNVPPDEMTVERALEMLAAPKGDTPIGDHPESGLPIYVKSGRFGPYVQLGDAETLPPKVKPQSASLFSTMVPENVSMEDALRLLSLPRVVGVDATDSLEITAQNGRYGPYLRKGEDSRSLSSEEQIFAITLEEAAAIYAAPKEFRRGRGGGPAKPPLADFGVDPATEKAVTIKDGRFGPYITDGETNVTVPRGVLIPEITAERAFEMLADKRALGPAPKKAKKVAKKVTAKKGASKTTAKKPAKKAAAGEPSLSTTKVVKKAAAKRVAKKAASSVARKDASSVARKDASSVVRKKSASEAVSQGNDPDAEPF